MVQNSGFFNAIKVGEKYDREYNAIDFAEYFSLFIGDGVFIQPTNQLKVLSKSGLTVTVKKGRCFIEGYWYELYEDATITFTPNSQAYAINNVIVCELNKSTREITLKKRESVSSISPIVTGTIHELVLASISLGVGVSSITDAIITDRRPYKEYCGFVTGVVEQISTEEMLTQLTTQFKEWFDKMKEQLTTDAAGSLQTQIDVIVNEKQTIRYGTSDPSDSLGKDGDIYIKIVG